jgi:anti-sigma B factor antagonist
MEITVSERSGVAVISAEGEMNALTAQDLAEAIAKSVRRYANLVIELSRVRYMSSAGIHVLFAAIKACRHRNGDLRLVGLQRHVHEVLNTSGLLGMTQVFLDVDSAVASFSAQPQA